MKVVLKFLSHSPSFRWLTFVRPRPQLRSPRQGLVKQLVARQFDQVEAQFDDQMKAGLPLSKLPEVWDSILAQTGPFKGIVTVKVTEKQGLHAAIVTCEFERALDARIYMDDQGKVKGLFFEPPSAAGRRASHCRVEDPSYVDTDTFHEREPTSSAGAGNCRCPDFAQLQDRGAGRGVGTRIGAARAG